MTEIQLQLALVSMGFVAHKPGIEKKGFRDSTLPSEHAFFSNSCFSFLHVNFILFFCQMSPSIVFVCVFSFWKKVDTNHKWLLAKLGFSSSLMTWKKNEGLLVLLSYFNNPRKITNSPDWTFLILKATIVWGKLSSPSNGVSGSSSLKGVALLVSE